MSDNKEHTKSDKIPLPNHKKLDTKTVSKFCPLELLITMF